MNQSEIEERVRAIVADALDHPVEKVLLDSSLVDDLGAESIDFLDIGFRIESEFGIEIPEDEVWKGALEGIGDDPAAIAERISRLREERPGFAWDRLPAELTKRDLPRLLTVRTVVEYLAGRLAGAGEGVEGAAEA